MNKSIVGGVIYRRTRSKICKSGGAAGKLFKRHCL